MSTELVLEVPEELQSHDFARNIIRIEHPANPTIYYGSRVPIVTLKQNAEQLGIFLGCTHLFGTLYKFKILFEGVLCMGQEDAIMHSQVPLRGIRPDNLIKCGSGRVYISPNLICPLPTLR